MTDERDDTAEFLELLHAATRGLRREAGTHLEDHGITLGQVRMLRTLSRCDRPQRPSEVAAALDVAPRSVTTKVDQAEADGFVRRLPDPSDRRATLVELTDLGREVLRRVSAQRYLGAESRLRRLSAQDRAELLRLLRVVAADATDARGAAPGARP